jgi:hypothetical protein
MDIFALLRQQGQHLFWHRMADQRVHGRPSGEPIRADEAYAVIRLAEMFLGSSRVLWRKFSPLVHTFVGDGSGATHHSVAGPGQLHELGEGNLDRVIVLNLRVAGPIPYKGGDVTVLCGLYSVPRSDAAAALVSTLGALSDLAGPGVAAAAKIAGVMKAGVDSILSLDSTQLRLGVSDTFGGGGKELRSGFHVGIGAPSARVSVDKLWIKDGHLAEGNVAVLARPFEASDYFVLHVERLERRLDWPGLPGLAEFEKRFSDVLRGGGDITAKKNELAIAWPRFVDALVASPHLTRFDARQIANDVRVDLRARVEALGADTLFEMRGWDGGRMQTHPDEVDFALVAPVHDAISAADEGVLRELWV